MGQRNVFPPEVVDTLKQLLNNIKNINTNLGFGDTVFDTSTGVVQGTTSTVVSYSPSSTEAVTGFTGNGEADANWTLYINGNAKSSQWTNQAEPNADFEFDNFIEIQAGDTVELEVENIGLRTADYEGTILIRL